MKSRYTITVVDNKTDEEFIVFDLASLNYKIETTRPVTYTHEVGDGRMITEHVGTPTATLTLSGVCLLGRSREKEEHLNSLSCQHEWIGYRGLTEEFNICGLCGEKK